MKPLLIHTSIDDLASSLKLMNPETRDEANRLFIELKTNFYAEKLQRNRISVLNLLRRKFNQIHKKWLLILILFISMPLYCQSWENANVGLYPNSLQLTYNFRNTSTGFMFLHLFEKSFLLMPVGLYGSVSSTIKPDQRYVNYPWERKFSFGGSVTLNHSRLVNMDYMFLCGAVYNWHPGLNSSLVLLPGQYDPSKYATTRYGFDMGFRISKNRYSGTILIEAFNLIRYVQLSFGYNFYKL